MKKTNFSFIPGFKKESFVNTFEGFTPELEL